MTRRLGTHMSVYAAVLGIALLCIPYPFWGDQALVTSGAEMMRNGALLYVDFWDIVQPGVYVFYLAAGSLFGFTEVGIHAFELAYLLVMGGVIYRTQRARFTHDWAAALIPLWIVGLYYAAAGMWELTQREVLALFPMYLSCWWASQAVDAAPATSARRFVYAGLAAAVVTAYKHLLAVIPGAFVATALLFICLRRDMGWVKRSIIGASAALTGLMAGLVLCFGYFVWTAGADNLWWTYVELPQRVIEETQARERAILVESLRWFGGRFTGPLVLACIGWLDLWRRRSDPFTMNLLVWLISGMAVWVIQLWWQYQLMLLVVPIGLLAAHAVDGGWSAVEKVAGQPPSWRAALAVCSVVVCSVAPLLFENALRGLYLVRSLANAESVGEAVELYQDNRSHVYAPARWATDQLYEDDALPGPIYVFGDPVYLYMSGRRQAIAFNGWSPEAWIPEMWERAIRELESTRPAYIVFTEGYSKWLELRPELAELLGRHYQQLEPQARSTWYVRRGEPSPEIQ